MQGGEAEAMKEPAKAKRPKLRSVVKIEVVWTYFAGMKCGHIRPLSPKEYARLMHRPQLRIPCHECSG